MVAAPLQSSHSHSSSEELIQMREVVKTWGDYGDESTLRVIYGKKVK